MWSSTMQVLAWEYGAAWLCEIGRLTIRLGAADMQRVDQPNRCRSMDLHEHNTQLPQQQEHDVNSFAQSLSDIATSAS